MTNFVNWKAINWRCLSCRARLFEGFYMFQIFRAFGVTIGDVRLSVFLVSKNHKKILDNQSLLEHNNSL